MYGGGTREFGRTAGKALSVFDGSGIVAPFAGSSGPDGRVVRTPDCQTATPIIVTQSTDVAHHLNFMPLPRLAVPLHAVSSARRIP